VSSILLVDDEEAVCWSLERALAGAGHEVAVAASAEAALKIARVRPPDAVLLDVRLPGMDGLTALSHLQRLSRDMPVIVMTAFGNLATAVGAVEGGAFDYLAKPFDLDQALGIVERALTTRATLREPQPGGPGGQVEATPGEFIGRSTAMQAVFKRIALAARRDASVLITGESGTGKELVARALHHYSDRRDRPFVPVHVAALNPNLVESELFGHAKGAFTGAADERMGLMTLANGGTIFLDELADIPMSVQVKLLRALEHGEITPVGSGHSRSLSVRIVAATHQDLDRRIAEGAFRHDLFFRLNVFQIHVPALRERREDIVPLAEHFLRRIEPRALPMRQDTARFLEDQQWPGNVRELRNALEHAVILACHGPLLPEHVPITAQQRGEVAGQDPIGTAVTSLVKSALDARSRQEPSNLYQDLLDRAERPLLDEIMRRAQGNRWLAARWLGMNRATLRKKLARHGLIDAHRPERFGHAE
jgi:two-component system nitrogen regulation response regulator GlnG